MDALPVVHPNGTSRRELLTLRKNTLLALNVALDELNKMAPHGRDYYTKGSDAYSYARQEHWARVEHVRAVYEAVLSEYEALSADAKLEDLR